MFAEMTVHATGEIDPAQFFAGTAPAGSLPDAISSSRFATTPEIAKDVVYWGKTVSSVTLIFRNGPNGLRIYIENHIDSSSIGKLKNAAEEQFGILRDLVKIKKLKLDDVHIGIHAENHLMQGGRQKTLKGYLTEQFNEKILGTFLVSLVGAGVGLLLSKEPVVAIWTFLGILIALGVRMLVEGLRYRTGFKYDDT
jgi:hypothetical protein